MNVELTTTVRVMRMFALVAVLGLITLIGLHGEPLPEEKFVQGMPAPAADAVAEPHPQTF